MGEMADTAAIIIIGICLMLFIVFSYAEMTAKYYGSVPAMTEKEKRVVIRALGALLVVAMCILVIRYARETSYERGIYDANHLKIYPKEEAK
jgi:hypothetical protein